MADVTNTVALVTTIQPYTALAVGLMLSSSGLGSALGWAIIGSKYMEGVARQPELMSTLRVQMFITAGLMESFPFVILAFGMWFLFANPFLETAKSIIGG
ncbi:ATP synthase subunit c [Gammaproteobacteria bacterium]